MKHPFRRAAARFIDYLLWSMATVLILGEKMGDIRSPSWLFYASFWVYVPIEAALVSIFKTTAGKAMLGIYVTRENGDRLDFAQSIKRAVAVFGAGMGCFLPYASLFLPFYALYRLVRYGSLFWDAGVSVACVATTRTTKAVLIAFLAFLTIGYGLTARVLWLSRDIDLPKIEDRFARTFFDGIPPKMLDALSENSILSAEAAEKTAADLAQIQTMLKQASEELARGKEKARLRIARIPAAELRAIRNNALDDFVARADSFLFAESMRVSLFESIIAPFKDADRNRPVFINGRPHYDDAELNRQYDNFMANLQAFLLSFE